MKTDIFWRKESVLDALLYCISYKQLYITIRKGKKNDNVTPVHHRCEPGNFPCLSSSMPLGEMYTNTY